MATPNLNKANAAAVDALLDKAGTALQPGDPETVYTLTGTTIDPANGSIQVKTLGSATTFTEALSNGHSVTLHLIGGKSYVITWPTITWAGRITPTLTGADVLTFWKVNATLYGAYLGSTAA